LLAVEQHFGHDLILISPSLFVFQCVLKIAE